MKPIYQLKYWKTILQLFFLMFSKHLQCSKPHNMTPLCKKICLIIKTSYYAVSALTNMLKRFTQNCLIVMIEKLGKPLDSTRDYATLLTYKSFWCLASWPDYCWTLKFGFLFPSVWLINKELTWTVAKLLNVRSLKVQCLTQLLCRIFFVINDR